MNLKGRKILAVSLIMLTLCFSACKEYEYTYEYYSFTRPLVSAYFKTKYYTNNFGGVTGTDDYFVYGQLENDGSVNFYEENLSVYGNCLNVSLSKTGESYVEYQVKRTIIDGNSYSDEITGYSFYMTEEMLNGLQEAQG